MLTPIQDLVFQQGEINVCPYPAIFGHEGAGTIKYIGPKVKDKSLKVGDFVLLSINYCEQCKFCKTGHPAKYVRSLCPDPQIAFTDRVSRKAAYQERNFIFSGLGLMAQRRRS